MRETIATADDVYNFLGKAFKKKDTDVVDTICPLVEDRVKKFLGYDPMLNYAIISGASNATPIQITTPTVHGFDNGASVYITGVQGNLAANGLFTIVCVDDFNFTLLGPLLGQVTAASEVGSVVTLSFGNPPAVAVGASIVLTGFTPAGYNGTWTVTGVSGSTLNFTCTNTGLPPAVISTLQPTGPSTTAAPINGVESLAYLNSVGSGAYTLGGLAVQNYVEFHQVYDRDLKMDTFADDELFNFRRTYDFPVGEKEINLLNMPVNNVFEVRVNAVANGFVGDFADQLTILDPTSWSWNSRGVLQRNFGIWPIKRAAVMVTYNAGYTYNKLSLNTMPPVLVRSMTDHAAGIRLGFLQAVRDTFVNNKQRQAMYRGGAGPLVKERVTEYEVGYSKPFKEVESDVVLTVAVQETLEPYVRYR